MAGAVMHEVGYDHGETSLHDVVKGMASALRHNTPLLEGLGSFESKLSNSSAQPRSGVDHEYRLPGCSV